MTASYVISPFAVLSRLSVICAVFLGASGCEDRKNGRPASESNAPVGGANGETGGVSSQSSIPSELAYTVIATKVTPGVMRHVTVRISRPVSEALLREVSQKLKAQDTRPYRLTTILYLLPGMKVGEGAWARANFDPDLKIRIMGLSLEQEKALRSSPADERKGRQLGRWTAQTSQSSITMYERAGTVYAEEKFSDGSTWQHKLLEQTGDPRGRRFNKKDSKDGEFWLIDAEGNLQMGDRDGVFLTLPKLV